MAEAIISRASPNIPEDILDPILTTSTTHGIKVTLKDPDGVVMSNWPIMCKDGSQTYNYTTNEKGQTIFRVSSGAANIFVNNYVNGVQYLDIQSKWMNIDAPVGLSTRANISMENSNIVNNFVEFTSSKIFKTILNHNVNIAIVGGGGGGGCAYSYSSDNYDWYYTGQGGGSGYLNYYNYKLENNILYNFISGKGGTGMSSASNRGGTGGTSYIVNTNIQAMGGNGGNGWQTTYNQSYGATPAIGGLGNSGCCIHISAGFLLNATENSKLNGGNSIINFAGGGGAGACVGYSRRVWNANPGNPYGGNVNQASSRGGGGGGGHPDWVGQTVNGFKGGDGLIRITFLD